MENHDKTIRLSHKNSNAAELGTVRYNKLPQVKITKRKEDNHRIERIIEFLQPAAPGRVDLQETPNPGRNSGLDSQSSSTLLPKDKSQRNSTLQKKKIKNLRTVNSIRSSMKKAKNIPTPVKGQGMQAQSVEQFEKNQEENEKRALLQGFQTLSQINASFGMAPSLNQPDGGGNDAAPDARIKQQMVP